MPLLDEKLSIAPMMDITDQHWRYFIRGLTKKTILYTEMLVDDTVTHVSSLDQFIGNNIEEQPSVIQLGGSNPEILGEASYLVEKYSNERSNSGYDEINLNCGCPSNRVSKRCFGASLMLDPELVRKIVSTMIRKVSVPVTVKCRIGADNRDSYEELLEFIKACSDAGAKKFIIHSRKAFLKGLSTKQNRDIPPLRYEVTHRLVKDFPELQFILNGGICTFEQGLKHMNNDYVYNPDISTIFSDYTEEVSLPPVHGVMIGRQAFNTPVIFANADSTFFNTKDPCLTRREIVTRYTDYCDRIQNHARDNNTHVPSASILMKPCMNLMNGLKNNSKYRRSLNDLYDAGVRGNETYKTPKAIIETSMLEIEEIDLDAPIWLGQGMGNNHRKHLV